MIRAKNWSGKDLPGKWLFTYKIDGVRVLVKDGVATSRTGKPLYNVPPLLDGDYECYLGTFKKTISALKTHEGELIHYDWFYSIADPIDYRLRIYDHGDCTIKYIKRELKEALAKGLEGLVLRKGDEWLKVKPVETHDLEVIGYQEGQGKHEGRMGALLTDRGKVGTGFTDVERVEFTEDYIVGKIIEVAGMQLTESGKIRHPRFIRLRLDKEE